MPFNAQDLIGYYHNSRSQRIKVDGKLYSPDEIDFDNITIDGNHVNKLNDNQVVELAKVLKGRGNRQIKKLLFQKAFAPLSKLP